MVKTSPLTVVVVLLLIAHNVYTLYFMRVAIDKPGTLPCPCQLARLL
jgi:hypothetical protein